MIISRETVPRHLTTDLVGAVAELAYLEVYPEETPIDPAVVRRRRAIVMLNILKRLAVLCTRERLDMGTLFTGGC